MKSVWLRRTYGHGAVDSWLVWGWRVGIRTAKQGGCCSTAKVSEVWCVPCLCFGVHARK